MRTLVHSYDCLLLDLDGTVFHGRHPIEGAVEALSNRAIRALFVTNNASRSASEVAANLRRVGICADPHDVVTSGHAAARFLASRIPRGSRVLVLGTEALTDEIDAVGLSSVRRVDDGPVAVVQGHSPSTGWRDLADAALAIRHGATWIATNADATVPTERGLVPGNGAMVAAVRTATGVEPYVVGKPAPPLFEDALARGNFRAPLVVGDRLDTDIAGANSAGLPSLLVLTGVTTVRDLLRAGPNERPTHVARNLGGLHHAFDSTVIAPHPAWWVVVDGASVTVTSTEFDPDTDGLAIIRATAHALWRNDIDPDDVEILPGDDAAWVALHRWSLVAGGPTMSSAGYPGCPLNAG